MLPEFRDFIDESRARVKPQRVRTTCKAFFLYWERFHNQNGSAGAFAIQQTDATRRVVRACGGRCWNGLPSSMRCCARSQLW
jgi:hypothetical protein